MLKSKNIISKLNNSAAKVKLLKRLAIFNCVLFVSAIFINFSTNQFLYHPELHWIFIYGKRVFILLLIITELCSFINTILLFVASNSHWKKNLSWLLLSAFPIILLGSFLLLILIKVWFE